MTRNPGDLVGVIYDRVSTLGQATNADNTIKADGSPEAQRQRCLDYLAHLSRRTGARYEVRHNISDLGLSGKNANRPGYQRMLMLIRSEKIQFVVASELSRLSRSVRDFLDLVALSDRHGVALIILGLDLDTSTPAGRVLTTVMAALAQFEREMTGLRVRENARSRLVKDGKINGASTLLGLDRDPRRPGHFVINQKEAAVLERLLRLYLEVPGRKALLRRAREDGITWKDSELLSKYHCELIFENVRWRYRGLWYANEKNRDKDQSALPEHQRYQTVTLPHGPVIDTALLDQVQQKIDATKAKKRKSGCGENVYLLSTLLVHEDGSKFTGESGKSGAVRYYFNRTHKLRIRRDEIETLVSSRVKRLFCNDRDFADLLAQTLKRKENVLPILDGRLRQAEKELAEIEAANLDLRRQLLDPNLRSQPGFMDWLGTEVGHLGTQREAKLREVETLRSQRTEFMEDAGLTDLRKTSRDYLERFDRLTPTERRTIIESVIQKIVVKPDNKLEIVFFSDAIQAAEPVNRWKRSTSAGGDGS